ncbi:MAG: hypothetical protein JEZ04_06430 [Spirochaetales bacterium]|nr:hypothetical protein [Spirochaetales bacterium]
MKVNRKIIIYLVLGVCAGLVSFSAVELLTAAGITSFLALSLAQGAALGFIFGFVFGFADGILYKELKSGLMKASVAALIGAITAAAAMILTSQGMIWTSGFINLEHKQTMGILLPLWRGAGWMLMGAAIGAVDGIQQRASRRTLAGILGGLLGGLSGGMGLEFIIRYLPEASLARAAGLLWMGSMIGLFLGEFEKRFSYARLRVLNGRLKDREFLLVNKKIRLGENLQDDLYLKGYKKVARAIISRADGEIYIEGENNSRILVNDQIAETKRTLKYQDVLKLGDVKLLYLPL